MFLAAIALCAGVAYNKGKEAAFGPLDDTFVTPNPIDPRVDARTEGGERSVRRRKKPHKRIGRRLGKSTQRKSATKRAYARKSDPGCFAQLFHLLLLPFQGMYQLAKGLLYVLFVFPIQCGAGMLKGVMAFFGWMGKRIGSGRGSTPHPSRKAQSRIHSTARGKSRQRRHQPRIHSPAQVENGHDFEEYVAHLLECNEFQAVELTAVSGDFGADILAEKEGRRYAFQCKYYSQAIGLQAVQEVNTAMRYYGCQEGVVVTNHTFTQPAYALARSNRIHLWDGATLDEMAKGIHAASFAQRGRSKPAGQDRISAFGSIEDEPLPYEGCAATPAAAAISYATDGRPKRAEVPLSPGQGNLHKAKSNAVKCGSCGATIQVDASGDYGICTYCGSSVSAYDTVSKLHIEIAGIDTVETLKKRANKAFAVQRFADAVQLWMKALDIDPTDFECYYRIYATSFFHRPFSEVVIGRDSYAAYRESAIAYAPVDIRDSLAELAYQRDDLINRWIDNTNNQPSIAPVVRRSIWMAIVVFFIAYILRIFPNTQLLLIFAFASVLAATGSACAAARWARKQREKLEATVHHIEEKMMDLASEF